MFYGWPATRSSLFYNDQPPYAKASGDTPARNARLKARELRRVVRLEGLEPPRC